jgi:hypothetical protein
MQAESTLRLYRVLHLRGKVWKVKWKKEKQTEKKKNGWMDGWMDGWIQDGKGKR